MLIQYEQLKTGDVYQTFFDRIFIVKRFTPGFVYCDRLYDGSNSGSRYLTIYMAEPSCNRHKLKYLGKEKDLMITQPELFI